MSCYGKLLLKLVILFRDNLSQCEGSIHNFPLPNVFLQIHFREYSHTTFGIPRSAVRNKSSKLAKITMFTMEFKVLWMLFLMTCFVLILSEKITKSSRHREARFFSFDTSVDGDIAVSTFLTLTTPSTWNPL